MKKIAVLIFGEYRSFDLCVRTYDPILAGNDIYFSTWDESHQTNPLDNTLTHNVVGITDAKIRNILSDYNVVATCIDHYEHSYWSRIRYNAPMLHRIHRGLNLIRESGIQYDIIIVTRPDIYFNTFHTPIDWDMLCNGKLYASWFHNEGFLSEHLLISRADIIMSNIFMSESDWQTCDETDWHKRFHNHVLSSGIKIENMSFMPSLVFVRPNIETINSYDDAHSNFIFWRDTIVIHQYNQFGYFFVRKIWGSKVANKIAATNPVTRRTDVITGEPTLETLHILPSFPISMDCVTTDASEDIFIDMELQIGTDSGILQIKNLVPPEMLYVTSHGGSVGDIWKSHHLSLAQFISAYSPHSVLEIGGGHGILSREYNKINDIPWTIIDPTAPVDTAAICSFFSPAAVSTAVFSAVVHSHVFEHMHEPVKFMQELSEILNTGEMMFFSVPNFNVIFREKYAGCINFEHTVLLTEEYIEFLLSTNGFRIMSKEYFLNNHSIFYAVIKVDSTYSIEYPKLYETNRQLCAEYINYQYEIVTNINHKLSTEQSPVYLFGAHIFSQFLIKFGLDTTKIVSILDNDPSKHHKRLYGTKFEVKPSNVLQGVDRPCIILRTGVYNGEIKAALLRINQTAVFIE